MEFKPFPKISRLSREVVISEKLDGTNAQVFIPDLPLEEQDTEAAISIHRDGRWHHIYAGSRKKWINVKNDNYGFANWVVANAEELLRLGPGAHFGEWWGAGIQRKYATGEKRFSLFNTALWGDDATRPSCCHVVPVLETGIFSSELVEKALQSLRDVGSLASPGFKDPEGIVIYHAASGQLFKKTLVGDEKPKGSKE